MRSYADDLANTDEVKEVVEGTARHIISEVQKDVSGRTNTINGNVNLLLNHVDHLNQQVEKLKGRISWAVALMITLQLIIIGALAVDSLPNITAF